MYTCIYIIYCTTSVIVSHYVNSKLKRQNLLLIPEKQANDYIEISII